MLQAHPGVDVAARQVTENREALLACSLAAHVLHEDQVPDLEVAVLIDDRAARAAILGPAVEVDLRARPAGARDAHRPEVVGHAPALDPVFRDSHVVVPELGCLIVVVIHRHPEPALREAEAAGRFRGGEQLPCERDSQLLEVIAEREVPQHLEERPVPGGLAHFLDVGGPHALLRAGRPAEGGRLLAEEVRLEGDHPRIDQQQRGILGDQAGGRYDRVPALPEVGKETAGDLCRLHQRPSFA